MTASATGQPAAPPPQTPGAHDAARAALRDLVALAAECAARETEIAQKHHAAIEQAEQELARNSSNIEMRVKAARDDVTTKAQARLDQIKQQIDAQFTSLKSQFAERKQKITDEYDRAVGDVNSKMQQGIWLAESVYEGAQNGVRADSKKAKETHENELAAMDDVERQADAQIVKYRQTPPEFVATDEPDVDASAPEKALEAAKAEVAQRMEELKHLGLPKLFKGFKPFLIVPVVCAITAVIANWVAAGSPTAGADLSAMPINVKAIMLSILGAAVVCGGLGALLWAMAKSQVRRAYIPLRENAAAARVAAKYVAEKAAESREEMRRRAKRKLQTETEVVKSEFAPQLARATQVRDAAMKVLQGEYDRKLLRIEAVRDKSMADAQTWQTQNADTIAQKHAQELAANEQRVSGRKSEGQVALEKDTGELQHRWTEGLKKIQTPLAEQSKVAGPSLDNWDDPRWSAWKPPKAFASRIRFGELRVDLKQITDQYPRTMQLPATFAVPATLTLPQHASLMIHFDKGGRDRAIATLRTTMFRLLTNLPAGRVRFTLIDPVGLGQNFAAFMHLADHDDALVGGRIWTEAEHIDQRLADLTEHMETVIQKYLRNEFATIDDYNAQAGELAEPYRFLVVADLPTNFSAESMRRLASIASTGARCGVYVLITRDLRQPMPGGATAHVDEIEAHCLNIAQQADGSFAWSDEVFKRFPLVLDPPPPSEEFITKIMEQVGRGAKENKRVEVPFTTIAPQAEKMWTGKASSEMVIPVGRAGATRLQSFKLGRGVAQHALIAGKTGSGKSTLLHALVTNAAMWYSPDEVEFYLVDFKKGVEFKTYASNELPHARAIAVESDREFGLSVLQRIDAELARRGELYRKAGVQDLASYRQTTKETMPRTLLIIDEFQEFFSEDDKLGQDSAVLIDRLVRQGRAFGIHVLLGSQTIGGTSGLSRSTLGQMAIRVALQTSEADSQLILGDNNSAARLLARPGEAIYNDAGGLVENNSPFQVAWLPDEQRDQFLRAVREKFKANGAAIAKREPAVVFEGNAPADITKNRRLLAALATKEQSNQPPKAWLGDPVAIKDATSVTFRRQAGANVLIVGQNEEASMALLASSIESLAAQSPGAKFVVLDGAPADSPLAQVLPRVKAALPNELNIVEYRGTEDAIAELAAELERRQSSGGANPPPIFLLVYALQRYRSLRKQEESFSFGSGDEPKKAAADKQFGDLLRDGPPVGMHVIACCDTAAALERTLDRTAMREFDNRVLFQMSAADSSNLIDSPHGNKLGQNRALVYSEEQGVTEKFRPYALPSDRWLAFLKQSLETRKT